METKELSTRAKFRLEMVKLVVDKNPKKPGSMSFDRFEKYFEVDKLGDYTVQDCLDAGVRMDDIQHDRAHGFIIVGESEIELYEATRPREMVEGDL
jgi:hypothetical protein